MEGFDYGFNKIFVLKSLGETDTYADDLYYNTIEPCCKNEGLAIEPLIELYVREDWDKAIELILQDEYSQPFVHIEMHGDKEKGLELRLGGYVSWPEVIRDLTRINIRSEFNLIITMATCFSIQTAFNIKMFDKAAPYLFSLTSRNETIEPEVTFAMYNIFFREMIATRDIYKALKVVQDERPDLAKRFVFLDVPSLFERVWIGIPNLYSNGDAVVQQFVHSFFDFQSEVIQKDISREEFEGYKEGFVRECNEDTINEIYRRCMATFFMYDQYPAHRQRFRLSDNIS